MLGPARIRARGVLAVVLEDELHVHARVVRSVDHAVPAFGDLEIERARLRRGAFILGCPVQIEIAPVDHPDASPVQARLAELLQHAQVAGQALVCPREIGSDRHIGFAIGKRETRWAAGSGPHRQTCFRIRHGHD